MARFSLKWLFVGVAVVAFAIQTVILVGVIDQRDMARSFIRLEKLRSEAKLEKLKEYVSILQAGGIRYSMLFDDGFQSRIYGEGGTLDETVAQRLLGSDAIEVWLENTTITPGGRKTMLTQFEHELEEPATDFFHRSTPLSSAK